MNKTLAIKVQNLTKTYKLYKDLKDRLKEALNPFGKKYHDNFYALNDVSFEIKKGETVGIIGKNGSGKSTLLKMITGVVTPTNGHIITKGNISSLLELGAGFNPEMTGFENIYLNGAIMGFSNDEIDAKKDSIIEFADIGEFLYQPMKSYSSGMFARLAFSVAINVEPDILIIDEALAVGDVYFVQKCMAYLNSLKEKGTTILFVSHDTGTIKNICDKAIFIDNGKLVEYGNTIQVTDMYLAHLFKREVTIVEKKETTQLEKPQIDNEEIDIPNLAKRLGNQKCQIIGVNIYDKDMNPIKSTLNNSTITLRMTFQNLSNDIINNLTVGYILKNAKGIELASSNSYADKCEIGSIGKDSKRTIKIDIKIPYLHQGNYTFTPTVGSIKNNNEIELFDRIDNAIALEIYTKKQIYVYMSLDTKYHMEKLCQER